MRCRIGFVAWVAIMGLGVGVGSDVDAANNRVEFIGHIAFVYKCRGDCANHEMTAVDVVPIDSKKVKPAGRSSITSHMPRLLIDLETYDNSWKPDELLNGRPVWDLRGKTLAFSVRDTPPLRFDRKWVADMDFLSHKQARMDYGLYAATTLNLTAGTLKAGSYGRAVFSDDTDFCGAGPVDITEQVEYKADIATVTIGRDTLTIPDGTMIQVLNLPIERPTPDDDLPHDHFKEFYEIADTGHGKNWVKRCVPAPTTLKTKAHKMNPNTSFCPPVVLEKKP